MKNQWELIEGPNSCGSYNDDNGNNDNDKKVLMVILMAIRSWF